MSDRDEVVVCGGNPEHDIGESEVSQKLPVADEHVQPVDVGLRGSPLGKYEITERRHAPSLGSTVRLPARSLVSSLEHRGTALSLGLRRGG